jgi:hypothetical protein
VKVLVSHVGGGGGGVFLPSFVLQTSEDKFLLLILVCVCLLGAFVKLRKETLRFVLPISPSVCTLGTAWLSLYEFAFGDFLKISWENLI